MSISYNYMSLGTDLLERAQVDRNFVLLLLYGRSSGDEPEDGEEELAPEVHETFEFGKLWDLLWYLLSAERRATVDLYEATDWLGRAVDGASPLNDDVEYDEGDPRFLTADEVKRVSAALNEVDPPSLLQHFDPAALEAADVYPGFWQSFDVDPILESFARLRSFYERAASANAAVIVWKS
jgi:hypothetical protein